LNIAQTGRRLGIDSDARFRFERGVDPAFMLPGLDLATRMVMDLCGGEPSEAVIAGGVPDGRRRIDFPISELRRLAGIELPTTRMLSILGALGFEAAGDRGRSIHIVTPPWRPDVEGKADIVEELVRIVGLDEIPPTPMARPEGVAAPVLTLAQRRRGLAKRTLAGLGLTEAVTWSFVSAAEAKAFGGGAEELSLANPISAELSDMRPSLFPGLIAASQRNADRGFGDCALFEVGQIYRGDRPDDQLMAASGIRRGTAGSTGAGRHWSGNAAAVSLYDAKADLVALIEALGLAAGKVQIVAGGPDWFHPGRAGTMQLGPKNRLAWFGELHPAVLEHLGIGQAVVGFELILDALPAPKAKATRTRPPLAVSDLQTVKRDYAFLVGRDVTAERIIAAAERSDPVLITSVVVFDLFDGESLGQDRKSIAIEVTLQPRERTLTDAEIDQVSARIVAAVGKATGAELRS
jgi:phenylalanyl-tRNA synthetase beta chain